VKASVLEQKNTVLMAILEQTKNESSEAIFNDLVAPKTERKSEKKKWYDKERAS
jgi:hypothetical protein